MNVLVPTGRDVRSQLANALQQDGHPVPEEWKGALKNAAGASISLDEIRIDNQLTGDRIWERAAQSATAHHEKVLEALRTEPCKRQQQ